MELLGLIAGNGPLPVVFAKEAQAKGITLVAVGHFGETRQELERYVESMTWLPLGELGALIRTLQDAGVKQAIMLGGIDKRRALQDIQLDERGWQVLARLSSRGDDALLVALARELEGEGIRVVSSQEWLAPWLAPAGTLSRRQPTDQERKDVELGIQVLLRVGVLDIGQAVLVKEGVILAVEAIEGTDQAILRGGGLGGAGAVVVKGSKTPQDLRFDLPVVGLNTLSIMGSVGATVLALEAGYTFLLDRQEMIRVADSEGISLLGWKRQGARNG